MATLGTPSGQAALSAGGNSGGLIGGIGTTDCAVVVDGYKYDARMSRHGIAVCLESAPKRCK